MPLQKPGQKKRSYVNTVFADTKDSRSVEVGFAALTLAGTKHGKPFSLFFKKGVSAAFNPD